MTPAPDFIRLTRNPDVPRPARFEPTPKQDGDVVIQSGATLWRRK